MCLGIRGFVFISSLYIVALSDRPATCEADRAQAIITHPLSTHAEPFCLSFPFSSFSTASSIFLKLQLLQKLG